MEPWGPERADINAGIIASTVANCHRDPKRRAEPFTPADFMPRFNSVAEPQTNKGLSAEHVRSVMTGLVKHQEELERMGRAR